MSSDEFDFTKLFRESHAEVTISSEKYGKLLWELPGPMHAAMHKLDDTQRAIAVKNLNLLMQGWLQIMLEGNGVPGNAKIMAEAQRKLIEEFRARRGSL